VSRVSPEYGDPLPGKGDCSSLLLLWQEARSRFDRHRRLHGGQSGIGSFMPDYTGKDVSMVLSRFVLEFLGAVSD
jgi:hypothetical protein